jgi:hypothetical protein
MSHSTSRVGGVSPGQTASEAVIDRRGNVEDVCQGLGILRTQIVLPSQRRRKLVARPKSF